MFVCDRFHDTAHGETVEIIVNEDQYAQCDGCKLRASACLDLFLGEMAESGRSACPVHQAYHSAQNHKEDQNAYIIAVGQDGDKSVVKDVAEGFLERKTGIE